MQQNRPRVKLGHYRTSAYSPDSFSPIPLQARIDEMPEIGENAGTKPFTKILYLALALSLAGILLYFSLRGLDWKAVGNTLRSARPAFILLSLAMGTGSLFLRAARWRILLSANRPVPYGIAFWATCAGYFGNSFLPARAGELVRTVAVSSRTGLSAAYVLTTALSERIVDAITLVVISSLVLLQLPFRPGWFAGATNVFVPLGLGGAIFIILLPRLDRLWRYLLNILPLPETLRQKISGIIDQVLSGASALHNAGRLFRFVGITLFIWLADALSTIIGGHALGLSFSLSLSFLLLAGLGLGSALPSTPGYVGIYQFVAVSVLTPFGISRTDAIAYIILAQALQYLTITFWGLLAFWKLKSWKTQAATDESAATHLA